MKQKITIHYNTFTTHEIEASTNSAFDTAFDTAIMAKKKEVLMLLEKAHVTYSKKCSALYIEMLQNIKMPSEGWLGFPDIPKQAVPLSRAPFKDNEKKGLT